jgi:hypothetical protein
MSCEFVSFVRLCFVIAKSNKSYRQGQEPLRVS